ncbi:MAG: MFS transporter [Alphaproteobacteria bacterium]
MTDDHNPAGRTAATNWSVVLLIVGSGIVCAFQIGKIPASIPVLRQELAMSLVTAGWVVSMLNATACLVGLAVGAFADLLGARRATLAALAVTAGASLAGALADTSSALLVTRFVEGMGSIVVFVSGPIVILRAARGSDMRLAYGLWGSYMPAGIAIMVIATPAMLESIGWRGIWMVNAGLLAAYLVVYWAGTRGIADAPSQPGPKRPRMGALSGDIRAVLASRGSWLLALVFATYTAGYACTTSFLPTYLIDELALSPSRAATITAIVIGANILGNLAGGWLLHRGAARWGLIASGLAIMGASSILAYQPFVGAGGIFVLVLIFSGCGGIVPASVFSGVPRHVAHPRLVGAGNGLVMQWSNIGQFLGPPLFAVLAATIGWSAAPWLVVGLSILGIGIAIGIKRIEAG